MMSDRDERETPMTDNDITALVAEAREYVEFGNGLNWQGKIRELADALESRPMTADRGAAIEIMAQALTGKQSSQLIDDRRDELLYVMRREAAIAFDALVASGALRPVADVQAEALEYAGSAAQDELIYPSANSVSAWLLARAADIRTPASPTALEAPHE